MPDAHGMGMWACGGGKAGRSRYVASRTEEKGCIIVAGRDDRVKSHEVWAGEKERRQDWVGLGGV
jgi:hypothetical protein